MDNTTLNNGTGGDIISTDDIGGGVKVQRVKIQQGVDGSATDVSSSDPLPVSGTVAVTGVATSAKQDTIIAAVDTLESIFTDVIGFVTTANLTSGSTYSSGLLSLSPPYSQVLTNILSNRTGQMNIYWYSDAGGTDLVRTLTIEYTAGDGFLSFGAPAFTAYVKYEFTNSAGASTTDFYFTTKFLTKPVNAQIATLTAPLANGMVGMVTRSVIAGVTTGGGGAFVNVKVNPSGTLETNATLAAGTALVGKVSIDQVTANANEVVLKTGSTTVVSSLTAALPAGTNNIGDVDVLTLPALVAGTAYVGKVRLTDGTTDTDIRDLANSNALNVSIVDGSGDQITSFGGGTQYTEDAAAAANPVGTAQILVADSTPALEVAEGNNVAQRGTRYGAAYAQIVTSAGAFVDTFGGGTQYTEGDVDASITGTATMMEVAANTLQPIQGTVADGLLVNLGANNDVTVTSGSVTANAGTNLNTSLLALEAGGNLASIKAKTDNIPALGQALAAASTPVVLTAAQITTLTPPAAITGYNLEATQTAMSAKLPATLGQKAMTASMAVVLASDQASVPVAATLAAETTKVIGVTRTADGAGNLLTSNSITPAAKFSLDQNITSILGTAPTTVGKLDVKGADGDVFVRNATAANLKVEAALAAAQTLATVSTVTNLSQMGGVAISLNTGVRDTGTQRVTIATNDVVPITDNAGSLTVDAPIGTPVNVQIGNATLAAGVIDETGAAAVDSLAVGGGTAHDAVNSGNPIQLGAHAVSHGATPTAVAAADRTRLLANVAGIPFVIGGHPNIVSAEYITTAAQTDDPVVAVVSAGTKIVVTCITVAASAANTVNTSVRIGFGTANVPTQGASGADGVAKVILSHPNIAAGSGLVKGSGSGIVGIGGDDEDLRITCSAPTTGSLVVQVDYYLIAS